jgi:hypothetical protein
MPSKSTPVTFELRYCRAGAPCAGASAGIVETGSGCWEAAREDVSGPFSRRIGVPVRRGAGLGALAALTAGTGD